MNEAFEIKRVKETCFDWPLTAFVQDSPPGSVLRSVR